jgi:hypothetical protein
MPEIEHERVTLEEWADGSKIEYDQYRFDPFGPWIVSGFEAYCGECRDQIAEHIDQPAVRISLLEHLLNHLREEVAGWRAVLNRIGGKNGS